MASRKEQKEQLRREREERERQARAAARRRRLIGYAAGGALAAVALVVVVVLLLSGGGDGDSRQTAEVLPDGGSVPDQRVTDLPAAARAAGCELRSYRGKSREHSTDIDEGIRYDSNPPSEGKHFEVQAEDGAYGESPGDSELVHTLEHGRVIIWFKPTLPKDQRADLKALFDEDPYQLVLTPRRNMPYAVAATAWNRDPVELGTGRLIGCPRMDEQVFDALRAFRDEHRGNGPEAIP
jgi:hypothetical protein